MGAGFDIFRLGCIRNTSLHNSYDKIIISIVCNYIFENRNQFFIIEELHTYLKDIFAITIEFDSFVKILNDKDVFDFDRTSNHVSLKLKDQKYNEIHRNREVYSLEYHIDRFIERNNYTIDYGESIKKMFNKALYENILSLTSENIKALISIDITNGYSLEHISAFNAFLDWNDIKKNNTIYNVFLNAFEFAIVTSGNATKGFSLDLFSNKKYLLDTNIIFRLLEIGGKERAESTLYLLKKCKDQGVRYYFSIETYKEILRKISVCVNDIKAINNGAVQLMAEVVEDLYNKSMFDDNFFTLYSTLYRSRQVLSIDDFEAYLRAKLKGIEEILEIELLKETIPSSDLKLKILSRHFLEKKKELKPSTRYKLKAAEVDAANILHVRKFRGNNNYNYSDVKSFYITTDKSLNKILDQEPNSPVSETILPSQLFLIHNALSSDINGKDDFEIFNLFIKKRNSYLPYTGQEVLRHIESISAYTTDRRDIANILVAYTDMKYNYSKTEKSGISPLMTITEVSKTYLDKKICEYQSKSQKYDEITNKMNIVLNSKLRNAINITKSIDVFITLALPVLLLCVRDSFELSILSSIILIVIIEILKFTVSSKTRFLDEICKKIYLINIASSSEFKLLNLPKEEIEEEAKKIIMNGIKIWKK